MRAALFWAIWRFAFKFESFLNMDTDKNATRESHFRSLLKGLSWRVLATLTTILVAYLLLREEPNAVKKALSIGGIEFFAKLGIYYAHERVWQRIPIGTIRNATKAG